MYNQTHHLAECSFTDNQKQRGKGAFLAQKLIMDRLYLDNGTRLSVDQM
jgi:hypothetical protein